MIEILHRARKYKKSNVQSEIEKRCANDNLEKFGPAGDFKVKSTDRCRSRCIRICNLYILNLVFGQRYVQISTR